ncbi:MAG: competence protein ComK [Erysipelotrichaceae bacterium]|nr:competence protein ComK [Erysipelotrichaceae bacterium]
MILYIKELDAERCLIVLDNQNRYEYYENKMEVLLERLCLSYGFTLQGGKRAVAAYLRIKRMVPICLSAEQSYMLFPIIDYAAHQRIWFNYAWIEAHIHGDRCCTVRFRNGEELQCSVSKRVFQKQLDRCYFYLYLRYCLLNRR